MECVRGRSIIVSYHPCRIDTRGERHGRRNGERVGKKGKKKKVEVKRKKMLSLGTVHRCSLDQAGADVVSISGGLHPASICSWRLLCGRRLLSESCKG